MSKIGLLLLRESEEIEKGQMAWVDATCVIRSCLFPPTLLMELRLEHLADASQYRISTSPLNDIQKEKFGFDYCSTARDSEESTQASIPCALGTRVSGYGHAELQRLAVSNRRSRRLARPAIVSVVEVRRPTHRINLAYYHDLTLCHEARTSFGLPGCDHLAIDLRKILPSAPSSLRPSYLFTGQRDRRCRRVSGIIVAR